MEVRHFGGMERIIPDETTYTKSLTKLSHCPRCNDEYAMMRNKRKVCR
jgi:hypothetical protein